MRLTNQLGRQIPRRVQGIRGIRRRSVCVTLGRGDWIESVDEPSSAVAVERPPSVSGKVLDRYNDE